MSTGEVKKLSGRTYGRAARESVATRAFDDIFNVKPKATAMKWGNTSFSIPRDDDPEPKRLKTDPKSDDPFSFDDENSPKKNLPSSYSKARSTPTVVTTPAVRITTIKSSAHSTTRLECSDAAKEVGDEPVMKKVPVKTYSRGSTRALIKDLDEKTQEKIEQKMRPAALESEPSKDLQGSSVADDVDMDDGLYIEKDDGSSRDEVDNPLEDEDEDPIFKRGPVNIYSRRKTEGTSEHIISRKADQGKKNNDDDYEDDNFDGENRKPITITFRSRYLDPKVYKKFAYSPSKKDPIGRLSNSKVVHHSELRHNDGGTTLIVVCSPKIGDGSELKQTQVQTKYFKDSFKDLKKVAEPDAEDSHDSPTTAVKTDPYDLTDKEFAKDESSQNLSAGQNRKKRAVKVTKKNSPETVSSDSQESLATIENISTRSSTSGSNTGVRYHKIFRSRNKGMTSDLTTKNDTEMEEVNTIMAQEIDETSQDTNLKTMEETGLKDHDDSQTMESDERGPSGLKMPLLINLEDENKNSDFENSQETQSSIESETPIQQSSQESTTEESSKRTRRAKVGSKPPPEERKIFRSRGARIATQSADSGGHKSIFKSPKKSAAVYNVRSWQTEMDSDKPPDQPPQASVSSDKGPPKLKPIWKKKPIEDEKDIPEDPPTLTRAVHWPGKDGDEAFTSVHVSKEHKELFTVVKNVKEAHLCQEFGETQDFDDDIEYLLEGLKDTEPLSTRCLSCIGLAQKCIIPAFRMHLRAHGTVTKMFGALQDAAGDPSLALCTSALMFMLSRDRLNMDLDQESLNLMLRLLGVDQQEDLAQTLSPSATRALNRNKDRVKEVYLQFQREAGAKQQIELDSISTGNLAMESLLSLTSRRAGEWFKEELRTLGALDHIVDTVCSCIEAVGDEVKVLTNSSIENLKKINRCLRVLENVTYLNADNQSYLISYKKGFLVSSLCRAIRTCHICLSVYPMSENVETGKVDKESFGWVIQSCSLAILRVLLNLTHENEFGCTRVGEQLELMDTVFLCILQSPQYVPVDLRFDMLVLGLGLLINLAEHCDANRKKMMTITTRPSYESVEQDRIVPATKALVELFCYREKAAQQLEEQDEPTAQDTSPNKSGEWKESDSGMVWVVNSGKKNKNHQTSSNARSLGIGNSAEETNGKDLDDEETFTKALHKAGKHMENSIVAAYVALLLGCLIQDNRLYSELVKSFLPDGKFETMVYMLKKFLGFMNLTTGAGASGGKSIARVIEILEAC
ncbi:hypothetical protein CHS0354_023680 [Potamilus streckersoni]|uniref:WAPL domain-containing protein n=1 Tax=Potamilus streckersoni TaxID=2493646 RepID=A0AAE0SBG6_9BIVA|nr:hypothetical protein CHS0354_023680 [Potamilus streckersoni]